MAAVDSRVGGGAASAKGGIERWDFRNYVGFVVEEGTRDDRSVLSSTKSSIQSCILICTIA